MFENRPANRYLIILPILAIVALFAKDTLTGRAPRQASQEHSEHEGAGDKKPAPSHENGHNDPEKNKRMGFYHYNEGNKALKENRLDEAVRNYKMALTHDRDIQEVYVNLSSAYLRMKSYDSAYSTLKTLEEKTPASPTLFYNYACYYSLTGQIEAGLTALRKATELGYKNVEEIKRDPDLENLRKDPKFAEWIKTVY